MADAGLSDLIENSPVEADYPPEADWVYRALLSRVSMAIRKANHFEHQGDPDGAARELEEARRFNRLAESRRRIVEAATSN